MTRATSAFPGRQRKILEREKENRVRGIEPSREGTGEKLRDQGKRDRGGGWGRVKAQNHQEAGLELKVEKERHKKEVKREGLVVPETSFERKETAGTQTRGQPRWQGFAILPRGWVGLDPNLTLSPHSLWE